MEPTTAVDPLGALLTTLYEKVAHGEWWPAAGILIAILTTLVKNGSAKKLPGPVGEFINKPLVSFSLPFVLAGVAGVITTLGSGQPFSAALLVSQVFKVASAAIVAWLAAKNVIESREAGKAAAAKEIQSKADAVREIQNTAPPAPEGAGALVPEISAADKAKALEEISKGLK